MTNNKTAINNQATEPGRFVEIDFIGIKSRKYGYKLTVFIGTFPGWEEVFPTKTEITTMSAGAAAVFRYLFHRANYSTGSNRSPSESNSITHIDLS